MDALTIVLAVVYGIGLGIGIFLASWDGEIGGYLCAVIWPIGFVLLPVFMLLEMHEDRKVRKAREGPSDD